MLIFLTLSFFEHTLREFITITFTSLIIIEYLNLFTLLRTINRRIFIAFLLSGSCYVIGLFFFKKYFDFKMLYLNDYLVCIALSLAAWVPLQIYVTINRRFFPNYIQSIINEANIFKERAKNPKNQISVSIKN